MSTGNQNPLGNPRITPIRKSDNREFDKLTRKLVAVPKAAVDEQRKEAK
jgi:hypothetical protein